MSGKANSWTCPFHFVEQRETAGVQNFGSPELLLLTSLLLFCLHPEEQQLPEQVQYGLEGGSVFLECEPRSPHTSIKWLMQGNSSDKRKVVSPSFVSLLRVIFSPPCMTV